MLFAVGYHRRCGLKVKERMNTAGGSAETHARAYRTRRVFWRGVRERRILGRVHLTNQCLCNLVTQQVHPALLSHLTTTQNRIRQQETISFHSSSISIPIHRVPDTTLDNATIGSRDLKISPLAGMSSAMIDLKVHPVLTIATNVWKELVAVDNC
jgi:hypothetical protein